MASASNYFSFLSKYKNILLLVFPVLPLSIAFLLTYKPSLELVSLAVQGKEAEFGVFDDREQGGKSIAKLDRKDTSIVFSYILQKGNPYPFSGITFFPKDHPYFDLSGYDRIRIRFSATKGKRIAFVFHTHINNYTRPGDFNTLQNSQVILNADNQKTRELTLSEFKAPEWWYAVNPNYKQDLPADYSKIKNINITNCLALNTGIHDQIRIDEIRFSVNLVPYFARSFLFLCIYYSAGLYLLRKKKKEPVQEINFVYEKTEHVNHKDKTEEAIFDFITNNYHRPDISIIEIQNATGIYEQKISSTIRTKTGLNFKQFLNKLRVAEAKRLLQETDLQVSEIAFKVGYGNVSHFNRVFKEIENCSPNEFRKQHASTIS